MPIHPFNFNIDPLKGFISNPYISKGSPVSKGSPYEDILSKMLQGYQMSQVPGQLNRKAEHETFANKIKGAEAEQAPEYYKERTGAMRNQAQDKLLASMLRQEYGPKKAQAELGKLEAQADMYKKRGELGVSGAKATNLGKLYNERKMAEEEYGPDSEQVKIYDAAIEKAAGTGVTGATRTKLQETAVADLGRRYLSKKEMPYIGTEALPELIADTSQYLATNDKKKKEALKMKLAKAIAAEKIAPEYAGYQLSSQGVRPTVHALKLQEKAIKMGWAPFSQTLLGKMPKDVVEEANRIHAQFLEDINKSRNKKVSEGFAPEKIINPREIFDDSRIKSLSDEELEALAGGQ